MMTRYEAARIIGIRAVQLSQGVLPGVHIKDVPLKYDYAYVAARELYDRTLDVCVERDGELIHISNMRIPPDVAFMVNTRDGENRT